jgi:hypothetical protein
MAGVLLGLAAAGCSASDSQPSDASSTPVTIIGPGSDIPNNLEARSDVKLTTCEPVGDQQWHVVAEAVNSTDQTVRYRLALRLAEVSDGNVVGREALTSDPVEPGQSIEIDTTATIDQAATDQINCIFVAIDRENVD